jgi:hypothetical protein
MAIAESRGRLTKSGHARDNSVPKTDLAVTSTEFSRCLFDEGYLWENVNRKVYGFLSMP